MRIFKTRTLAKFARKNGIADASSVTAVEWAMEGAIDADLGGRVIKQRVARPGQDKRGGFRLLIAFGSARAVFLYGFAKNERENIQDAELMTLREIAATFLDASSEQIAQALKDGALIEVRYGKDDDKEA